MVYSLVVRACGLEYGGREFKSRSLHLKPETELREERCLPSCRKGLKTVPLAQALLSLKPSKTNKQTKINLFRFNYSLQNRIEIERSSSSSWGRRCRGGRTSSSGQLGSWRPRPRPGLCSWHSISSCEQFSCIVTKHQNMHLSSQVGYSSL